ncbi:MAG: YidC/Oxa1 family membrane protein insertase [Ruminococcus sp.]|nr:YidC/Oxa1 family membrane protein insertase [Ruminococcus sp.]
MMTFFNFFGSIFGYVLWPIFYFVQNYGIAIIIFAFIAKIVLFPFSIKQQKSMASNARLQKKQQEIREKYKNNRQKANEEIQKLYQTEGINPSSGCLNSIVPMLVMLGIFYSISSPLTNTLHLNADLINNAVTYSQHIPGAAPGGSVSTYYQQIQILDNIGVISKSDFFRECFTSSQLDSINFLASGFELIPGSGISMLEIPNTYGFFGSWYTLIPVLCFLSSVVTQIITMRVNGTQMQGCMMVMMFAMPLFSAYIAYSVPAAVGFYWICSTLLSLVQSLIMHKFYNPVSMVANQEARHIALMEQNESNVKKAQ